MINVTDENFSKEVLNEGIPVLVDFWADWCAPCKTLAPVLESIASTRDDIKVVKVNVETAKDTVYEYGIRNLPTLIMFNKGEVCAVTQGNIPKQKIIDFINDSIDEE